MAYALEIEGLEKTYANGLQALKGIDLRVAEGDFFALLGPNGAGKSTTIGIICSLVNKTGGTVRVNGVDLNLNWCRVRKGIYWNSSPCPYATSNQNDSKEED